MVLVTLVLVGAWLSFKVARFALVTSGRLTLLLMLAVAVGTLVILRALLLPRRASRRRDADGPRQLPRAV